ncbi:glucan biosynthesis protein [Novosphingobium resinovorum]|uniref:Glucan biosynthesis protein D n=1 Tax=Novosphingobium resinovorum TaxID=158500 RepID=A0A1D8A6V7_9SPHN|nr:glucan biosynthesis protein [Novosphingobium resinovorum]AOR77848.1 glucan biosynthesis protein D [Novosphingobium resinovorum]
MSRRTAMGLMAALAAASALPDGVKAATGGRLGTPEPFSWDRLVAQARDLARKPYAPIAESTRAAADYDAAGKLTYGDAPMVAGNVRLFPAVRGTAPKPVTIAVVEGGQARAIVDTSDLFVGGHNTDAVGFRVMDATGRSDWLAFQGASYFRSSGDRDQYGLSARAIAIDTGLATGEEFPDFTRFWIEQTGADSVRIHALLDGPSLAGAYAFDCRKTANGVTQDVTAALFLRKDVKQLGLGAASSMFWYDQSSPARARGDWRPEIHDSDGLAIWSGNGERVWRPLENPAVARLHALRSDSPKGFGLLQRDQAFDHYQDDGVFYDRRPSLWVEPKGDWGAGAVGLYEMPTGSETLDNIALFWRPDRPAKAGQRRDFAYRLTWTSKDPTIDGGSRCVDVFEGPGGSPGSPPLEGVRKFVFDFSGPALAGLDRTSGVTPDTDLPKAAVVSAVAYPVARSDGRWRAMIDVRSAALTQPQFRLFLKRGNSALSETVIKALES